MMMKSYHLSSLFFGIWITISSSDIISTLLLDSSGLIWIGAAAGYTTGLV